MFMSFELIFASFQRMMTFSTPAKVASPRDLIAFPESVPGPQTVVTVLAVSHIDVSMLATLVLTDRRVSVTVVGDSEFESMSV